MFHGVADDYVPVAPCRAYVERLRARRPRRAADRISRRAPRLRQSARRQDADRRDQGRRACAPARSRRSRSAPSSMPRPASPSATRTRASQTRPSSRLQRGGGPRDAGGGEGPAADGVQARLERRTGREAVACWPKPNRVSRPAAAGVWRSLVARKFWVLQVAGSNPAAPTTPHHSSSECDRTTDHDGTHLQAGEDRDAVRHRQDQGMGARLRAGTAARDRAADGLDQLGRHAPAGAVCASIPPRRRSPIASATASPTRSSRPSRRRAASSPTPTISPSSAAIPGRIEPPVIGGR